MSDPLNANHLFCFKCRIETTFSNLIVLFWESSIVLLIEIIATKTVLYYFCRGKRKMIKKANIQKQSNI